MTKQPKVQEAYIGDAVYAQFDGHGIELYTSNGIERQAEIYFEPEVLKALVVFARANGFTL